jgi:lysophospholipase L1-like esterase
MTRTLSTALLLALLAPLARAQPFAERWREKVQQFARENPTLGPDKDIVLFGSSSMEGWRYSGRVGKYLPTIGSRTVNRGISGDGIGAGSRTGLANRLDVSVFQIHPKFVFMFNGRNSLNGGLSPARTAQIYERVVRTIQAKVPGVTVVVVTVPPVRGRYARLKDKIVEYNALLRTVAERTGARLIDLHPRLVDADGYMKSELTHDGLHFKNAGYAILGRLMEETVAAVEREQAQDAAADAFARDGEALLATGTLDPGSAAALRREIASRRATPHRCFRYATVDAFMASLPPNPRKDVRSSKGALQRIAGLGGW